MDVSLGVLFGAIALLLWSVANIAVAKAVRGSFSLQAAVYGQLAGLAALVIAMLIFGTWQPVPRALWVYLIVIGLLSIPIYWCFYNSFAKGLVAVVVPISSSYAVLTVAISIVVFGERLSTPQLFAIVAVIIGTILLARQWGVRTTRNDWLSPGAGFALATAALWGIQFSLVGPVVEHVHWLQSTLITQTISAIGLTIWLLVSGDKIKITKASLGYASIAGTLEAGAFLAYNLGCSLDLTAIVAPVAAATPLVTIPLSAWLLREKPTLLQCTAITILVAGIVLLAL